MLISCRFLWAPNEALRNEWCGHTVNVFQIGLLVILHICNSDAFVIHILFLIDVTANAKITTITTIHLCSSGLMLLPLLWPRLSETARLETSRCGQCARINLMFCLLSCARIGGRKEYNKISIITRAKDCSCYCSLFAGGMNMQARTRGPWGPPRMRRSRRV